MVFASSINVGHSQNHLAVAGGCKRSALVAIRARWLRTHPLPQVVLTVPKRSS